MRKALRSYKNENNQSKSPPETDFWRRENMEGKIMVIQHNMTAANANRNLGVTTGQLAKSTEKLSSGYKINRAGDNAAGLAISEKMRGQIRGLDQASTNAEDGISMIQTAEGALTETHSILQRMRELAVQASSDTNTDDDRTQIQNEIDQLTQEVDRIATTTEFNTKKLIDGSAKGAVSEKAGKANVDATFANSNVSAAITKDGSAKAAFSDVIRIEITEDFTAGKSTKGTDKYSSSELDAAITAMTSATGYAAGNTLEENRANAVKELTGSVSTAKNTADISAKAVSDNSKLIDDIVATVEKADAASIADNGQSLFAAGKTSEDLKKALTDAVAAYTTEVAGGAATSVANIKKTISDLFSQDTTAYNTAANMSATFAKTKTNTGADNTAETVTAATDAKTTGTSYATALDKLALQMGTTASTNNTNQTALDTAQRNLDILSDKDLVEAKTQYDTANAAKTAADAGGNQSAKDIAQVNYDNAKNALDALNKGKSVMTVTDLFGNTEDTTKFQIGSSVDDDNNLTITLKNKSGDDTVITISNADKMKAGDVITITAKEMVETEQAPTGKDAFRLQVGANAGQEVMLGINSMKAKDLNIVQTKEGVEGKALDVTNQASASLAVNAYDMAIQSVSTERAKLGATQNRLEHTISNLDTSSENLQAAESSLRDTDMAEEMTKYSKNNILMQAGQSMLAQANQSTQGVLSLLG